MSPGATPGPIVAVWNGRRAKGRELWFHLRIVAATAAGHPWLTFICPAWQQIGEIDLAVGTRSRPGYARIGLPIAAPAHRNHRAKHEQS
jgi:hypothetical protein